MRAFTILVATALTSFAAQSQTVYEACDIGSLRADLGSTFTTAINDLGHLTGQSGLNAFLWAPATGIRDLGALPGDFESFGFALNDVDVVTGWSSGDSQRRAFIWRRSSGMQLLASNPGATDSFGAALNDRGVIVGADDIGGFIFDRVRGSRLLAPIAESQSLQPTDINNFGKVVGFALSATRNDTFLMDLLRSKSQLLPLAGAAAINDLGRVAGNIRISDREIHAATWDSSGGVRDLGLLVGDTLSNSRGINNAGVVVGESGAFGGARRAMIWDSRNGMRNLNDLIVRAPDQAALELTSADGINNFGWIAANAIDNLTFEAHVLVLIPRMQRAVARFSVCAALMRGQLQPQWSGAE